jgi:hypothetical protein
VPPTLSWRRSQIIVDYLSPIVIICVINQSCNHWLHNGALHFAISMSLKLKEEIQMFISCGNLMEEDLGIVVKLAMFAFNIKNEVYVILDFSFPS